MFKGVAVEYITSDPFPIVDILDGTTKIGRSTENIKNTVYPCAKKIAVVYRAGLMYTCQMNDLRC